MKTRACLATAFVRFGVWGVGMSGIWAEECGPDHPSTTAGTSAATTNFARMTFLPSKGPKADRTKPAAQSAGPRLGAGPVAEASGPVGDTLSADAAGHTA